jgi:hypothetical protein
MRILHKIVLCTLFTLASLGVEAQFVEFGPVPKLKYKSYIQSTNSSRLASTNSLPFWDDFSQGMDTLKWEFQGSTFSNSMGNNAPSLGVIVFDGVDATGRPYSREIREQGAGDYLTSNPFDLAQLSQENQESLYLSFFWQAGGQAEMPDENDRLSLQLLDADSVWNTVWTINGGADKNPEEFIQEIVPVSEEFLHDKFQFRFVNFGRLAGPFDTWLLDYVFLSFDRDDQDLSYLDRALTRESRLFLGDYTAVPLGIYQDLLAEELLPVTNEFKNLEDRFRAMEYSIRLDGESSTIVNLNTPFNPVPNAQERRVFESNTITELPALSVESDIEILTYLTTGDQNLFSVENGDTTFFASVDYRINDTVRSVIPIRDFFAYDGGQADYAAGINQRSGLLAVKYEVDSPVFLTGVSIDFTNPDQADQPIDILVWQDLKETPIYREELLIPLKEAGEELIYFPIDTNIQVQGEFFVGFSQFSNDFIYVGLNKENDQADKIFYNVNGAWAQNEEVRGSLLIRPHISFNAPFAESEIPGENLRYYPNPVENQLHLVGKYSEMRIFDSFGREIFPDRYQGADEEIINFTDQLPGVYVIRALTSAGPQSFRILVK